MSNEDEITYKANIYIFGNSATRDVVSVSTYQLDLALETISRFSLVAIRLSLGPVGRSKT